MAPSPAPAPASARVSPAPPTRFAPYADVTLKPGPDLTGAQAVSGVSSYTLAFVVSGAACVPSWGGQVPADGRYLARQLAALRRTGGRITISFGGRDGGELAQTCRSPGALASAYRRALNAYGATRADFDIEGAALTNRATLDRRSRAIALLEGAMRRAGHPLRVSFTLPVEPTGLTPEALAALRSARTRGARVDLVNVLAMDYGRGSAPNPSGRMGRYAVQAATNTEHQLRRVYSGRRDSQLWSGLGITPMVGVNDVINEVFTIADANYVLAFARRVHLGALSLWSLGRDGSCPGGGNSGKARPDCSGIDQPAYAFSRALRDFRG